MFKKITDFENLYKAYKRARQGKSTKVQVAKFDTNVLEAILLLQKQLRDKTYTVGKYHFFYVYEPKKRKIQANEFKDKVVEHSLCDNVMNEIFERQFIYDNYASQKGKGTHFGLERLKGFLRKFYRKHGTNGWILKCDISHYFDSIDKEILRNKVHNVINDSDVNWLIDLIIDSTPGKTGIPIGNQTSQYFALFYLSEMDHWIKEDLRIKYYGRYVDDFFLIHHDKEYLKYCWKEIEKYLDTIGLKLNKKTQILPIKNGIDILGFHIYVTDTGKIIMKLRQRSKCRMKRKLKKMKEKLNDNVITRNDIFASWQAWNSHASHGNTYYMRKKIKNIYEEIINSEE